jgi:hypothetical protein
LEDEEVPKLRSPVGPVTAERRQNQLDRIRDDPFYILGDNRRPISQSDTPASDEDFDTIPIVQFDGGTNLLTPITKVRKKKKKAREIVLDEPPIDIAVDEMPENAAALSDAETNGQKQVRKGGTSVLSNKQAKGLEDIDFEEEERMEKEAIEAEKAVKRSGTGAITAPTAGIEEPLVVERVRKKERRRHKIRKGSRKDKVPEV